MSVKFFCVIFLLSIAINIFEKHTVLKNSLAKNIFEKAVASCFTCQNMSGEYKWEWERRKERSSVCQGGRVLDEAPLRPMDIIYSQINVCFSHYLTCDWVIFLFFVMES